MFVKAPVSTQSAVESILKAVDWNAFREHANTDTAYPMPIDETKRGQSFANLKKRFQSTFDSVKQADPRTFAGFTIAFSDTSKKAELEHDGYIHMFEDSELSKAEIAALDAIESEAIQSESTDTPES